jgi:hypothetical protein
MAAILYRKSLEENCEYQIVELNDGKFSVSIYDIDAEERIVDRICPDLEFAIDYVNNQVLKIT